MATKELTHLGTYVVPKINLLPPEIDERKAQQRAYVAMGATVVAALGAVGFLYMGQASRVGAAEQELADAKSQRTKLAAQKQKLAYVNDVYLEVDANEALLQAAIRDRVFWSRNLHDVGLQIPKNVWLSKMEITQEVGGPPTDMKADALPVYNLGKVSFEGRAFSHDDVASWLTQNAKIRGYANVWFTESLAKPPTAEERAKGGRYYIEFKSQGDISPAAVQPVTKAVKK